MNASDRIIFIFLTTVLDLNSSRIIIYEGLNENQNN